MRYIIISILLFITLSANIDESSLEAFSEPYVQEGIFSEESSDLEEEEYLIHDRLDLKQSYLFRSISNKSEYPNSPYIFALAEGDFVEDSYEISAGLLLYKDSNESGATVNQLSYNYFSESIEFKVGQYVNTLGVLDYMSSVNLTNPTRAEFFDDPNINIRKIPLLMSDITYYASESLTFKAIVQPFDKNHQDYTNAYLNFVLDAYLPTYIESLGSDNEDTQAIIDEIFIPTYGDDISPELNAHIQSKYETAHSTDIDKMGIFLVSEYIGDESKYGVVWINRYSEIPYIEINEEVLDIVQNLESGEDISNSIEEYSQQEDLDPISNVEGYRYNQYNLYYEGTLDSVGIRMEASYRDKLPTLNEYSWLSTFGFGVDYSGESMYNNLELQWLHLDSLGEDIYAGILTTKFNSVEFDGVDVYFSHYLVFGYYDALYEVATYPNITAIYDDFSLTLQYIASKQQSELNSASMILKAVF